MKRYLRLAGICCALMGPFVAFLLWDDYGPALSGWWDMQRGIQAIRSHDWSRPIAEERSFGINTFTNKCSSGGIKSLYESAAQALASRSQDQSQTQTPALELKTYLWQDALGWDRVSTVLQATASGNADGSSTSDGGKSGYIEVIAACSNDNDAVAIVFSPGRFKVPEGSRLLPTTALPQGLLRCDWPQDQP